MPLVRFELRNEVGLGDPELYGGAAKRGGDGEAEPKALLEGVAAAGLVGILRQLGDLAEFAADVFHDLHEQIIMTSARGRKVLTGVQNIEAALPYLEKAVKNQKNHIHFTYVPGSDWHPQLQCEQNQLLSSDLPRFMMDFSEECRDPPQLYLLDKFDNSGAGACMKRYSDPSYFKKSWNVMRADKTGNLEKEKRSHKVKRKGSRLKETYHGQATSRHRNGELQGALTAVQLTSRRFGSPNNNEQSFSEHRTTSDAISNPDNISISSLSSSKTRQKFAEQVSDTKPSVVPQENGHDKMSNINQHNFIDASSPIMLNRTMADYLGYDSKQGPLPDEMVARSPSVEWDEKAAIVMNTSSVYCDDVVMDRADNAETKDINPGGREIDHREMETMEKQGALFQKAKSLLLPSGLNYHDEVPSETDNYMDALNTLESETETDVEFQTRIQRKPLPSFNVHEPQVESVDAIISQLPEYSVAEFPGTCQNSGYTDIHPNKWSYQATVPENNTDNGLGDIPEVLEPTLRAYTATPLNPWSLGPNEILYNKAEDSPKDSPEISKPGLSTDSVVPLNKESAVNQVFDSNPEDASGDTVKDDTSCLVPQPTISFSSTSKAKISPHDTTGSPSLISERKPQDYPGENHEEFHGCDMVEMPNSQIMPLNRSLENGRTTEHLPSNTLTSSIGVSSVKLWTNAGLFGLEPSKPPVFGAQDGPREDALSGYEEHQRCHSTNHTELHCVKPAESAGVDVPNENTPDTVRSQTDRLSDRSISFANSGHKNIISKQTSISELLLSEDNAENGAETYSSIDMTGRNNMHVVSASSFSSIAQRFLANTLQRRISPKYNDLPMSSGRVNTDANGDDQASKNYTQAPSETVFEACQLKKKTENVIDRLSQPSKFSTCHNPEKSSPPLEHMKISFHPMSAFEMSNLNLDFSDGNLHENVGNMMLPTFQLLPGSSAPQLGSDSESENDTFGRSYSYSSYDDLSPRLYSNSEMWDQEDGIGLEDHELCKDSNQIGSSTKHISIYMGFEQMNLSGETATISLPEIDDHDGVSMLESHSAGELPNFDTLISTNNHHKGDGISPHSTINLSPEEDQLPPPPPLPPMQWRTTRQTALEEERSDIAKDIPPMCIPVQEELLPIAPPVPQGHAKEVNHQKVDVIKEISILPNMFELKASLLQQIRDKPDQQKQNGYEKLKPVVSDLNSSDEKGDLLQQIRNKTFNLRRANVSKTNASSQSTANSNVVAILEKANAIRLAVASEEGGDDDNWSDI